jgi:hypothetical protein
VGEKESCDPVGNLQLTLSVVMALEVPEASRGLDHIFFRSEEQGNANRIQWEEEIWSHLYFGQVSMKEPPPRQSSAKAQGPEWGQKWRGQTLVSPHMEC